MRQPTPRTGAPPAKRTAKTSAEPPFLRFYHSAALRKRTFAVLDSLERADDATEHRAALADLVIELSRSGMDYYFMRSLKQARAGFIVEQTASLGLSGVQQVMGSVTRQIIGRMEAPQRLSVCASIRQLML